MVDELKPLLHPEQPVVEPPVETQSEVAPAAPEVPATPETPVEEPIEEKPMEPEKVDEQVPVAPPTPVAPAPKPQKDELTQEVEEILAEGLEEIYKSLPADRRAKFKEEGEKTAGLIKQMIEHGKFHGRKIVDLIRKWLMMIPGVNRFFLEKEAKIKADKLQQISEEQKNH